MTRTIALARVIFDELRPLAPMFKDACALAAVLAFVLAIGAWLSLTH